MKKLFAISTLFILIPAILFAEEEAHGGGLAIVWSIINFVIFGVFLFFITRKSLAKFLKERAQEILSNIDRAHSALSTAKEKSNNIENKLLNIDVEISKLKNEMKARIEAEKNKIFEQVKITCSRIELDSKSFVDSEVIKSKKRIQEKFVGQVIEKSEQLLRVKMNESNNEDVLKRFIA